MPQEEAAQKVLTSAYLDLRGSIDELASWFLTPTGADLWIDGTDALRSTPPVVFSAYLSAFQRIVRETNSNEDRLTSQLACFDAFLDAVASLGEAPFLHGLAVGIAILRA